MSTDLNLHPWARCQMANLAAVLTNIGHPSRLTIDEDDAALLRDRLADLNRALVETGVFPAQPVAAIPEATGKPRDFLKWWTSIETDTRKSLLVGAHRNRDRLHALLRMAYEADSLPAIPEAGQSVPKLTDAQCHKIHNQAATDCDTWADNLMFEPSKYEVSGFMVRAIFKSVVIASMSADAEKGGAK